MFSLVELIFGRGGGGGGAAGRGGDEGAAAGRPWAGGGGGRRSPAPRLIGAATPLNGSPITLIFPESRRSQSQPASRRTPFALRIETRHSPSLDEVVILRSLSKSWCFGRSSCSVICPSRGSGRSSRSAHGRESECTHPSRS